MQERYDIWGESRDKKQRIPPQHRGSRGKEERLYHSAIPSPEGFVPVEELPASDNTESELIKVQEASMAEGETEGAVISRAYEIMPPAVNVSGSAKKKGLAGGDFPTCGTSAKPQSRMLSGKEEEAEPKQASVRKDSVYSRGGHCFLSRRTPSKRGGQQPRYKNKDRSSIN